MHPETWSLSDPAFEIVLLRIWFFFNKVQDAERINGTPTTSLASYTSIRKLCRFMRTFAPW